MEVPSRPSFQWTSSHLALNCALPWLQSKPASSSDTSTRIMLTHYSSLGAPLVGSSTSTSVTSTVGGGWSTTTSPPLLWMSALPSVPSFSSSVFSFLARLCLIIGAPLSLAPLLTELVLLSERQSAETITTVLAHGSGKLLATNEGSNLAAYQNRLCRGAIVGNNCEGERLSYVRIIQRNLWLVFLEVSIPLIVSVD